MNLQITIIGKGTIVVESENGCNNIDNQFRKKTNLNYA